MKKLLIAAICCGMLTFSNVNSVEAAEKDISNVNNSSAVEIQDLDFWSHTKHKIFGGHRRDDDDDRHRGPHQPPPPPPRDRHHPGYGPGPHRGPGPHHYPPPPPPHRR